RARGLCRSSGSSRDQSTTSTCRIPASRISSRTIPPPPSPSTRTRSRRGSASAKLTSWTWRTSSGRVDMYRPVTQTPPPAGPPPTTPTPPPPHPLLLTAARPGPPEGVVAPAGRRDQQRRGRHRGRGGAVGGPPPRTGSGPHQAPCPGRDPRQEQDDQDAPGAQVREPDELDQQG